MWRLITPGVCAAVGGLTVSTPATAQTYPAKPIRIVNGFAPGGPTDIYARLIGQKLTTAWGQQVIVDPRPGASGNIGAEHVARSTPDGYTLFLPSFSIAVNPSIFPKLGYDVLRDEGRAYAWRLQQEGTLTDLVEFGGMLHGFLSSPMLLHGARRGASVIAGALREALIQRAT